MIQSGCSRSRNDPKERPGTTRSAPIRRGDRTVQPRLFDRGLREGGRIDDRDHHIRFDRRTRRPEAGRPKGTHQWPREGHRCRGRRVGGSLRDTGPPGRRESLRRAAGAAGAGLRGTVVAVGDLADEVKESAQQFIDTTGFSPNWVSPRPESNRNERSCGSRSTRR